MPDANTLLAAVLDQPEESILELENAQELKDTIRERLHNLSYNECTIIQLLYGLGDGNSYTIEDACRILGLPEDRVVYIETNAISMLKHMLRNEIPKK